MTCQLAAHKNLTAQGRDVKIVCVGRKGRDALRRVFPRRIVETFDLSAEKTYSLATVKPVADYILRLFEEELSSDTPIHPDALRRIAASLDLIDDAMRASPEANRIFLDLLLGHHNPSGRCG